MSKQHSIEDLVTWAKAFSETDFGIYFIDSLRDGKKTLLDRAMSDALTAEQKALTVERAAGIDQVLTDVEYFLFLANNPDELKKMGGGEGPA